MSGASELLTSDAFFMSPASYATMDLESGYDAYASFPSDNVMSVGPSTPSPKSATASATATTPSSSSSSSFAIGPLPPVSDADLSAFQFADLPDFGDAQALSFSSFPPQLLPPEYKQHYDAAVSVPLDSDALFAAAPGPIRSTRATRSVKKEQQQQRDAAPVAPLVAAAPILVPATPSPAPVLVPASASSSRQAVAEMSSPESPNTLDGEAEADGDETSDAYKKELHRNTERQRRQKTNDAMNSLRRLIGNKHKKKLAILTETIRQFHSMQTELQQVNAENQRLKQRMDKTKDVKVEVVGVPSVDWGSVFLHNDICTAVSSLDMKFIAVNQAFTNATGHRLSPELTWQAITPPDHMADAYTVMAALLRDGHGNSIVSRDKQSIVTAGGSLLPCKVIYSLIRPAGSSQGNSIMIQLFPIDRS